MVTDLRKKIIKPIIIFVILVFLVSIFAGVAVHFISMWEIEQQQNLAKQQENSEQNYEFNIPQNVNINLSWTSQQ